MVETKDQTSGRPSGRSRTPVITLIIVLAVAALALGIGLRTGVSGTQYACMTLSQQGSDVHITTSGIIHVSGSQYYITCPEGVRGPTSSITMSCLTINPHTRISPYPDGSTYSLYYLETSGHTITAPPTSPNSSVVLQPASSSTVVVAC